MPGAFGSRHDRTFPVQQVVQAQTDGDYFNQLVPAIRDATENGQSQTLLASLTQFAQDRDAEIERICHSNHQGFVFSVDKLLQMRESALTLTVEMLSLNNSVQSTMQKLSEHKTALVESRGVRQNIDESTHAITDCLEVLRLANEVHDLLDKKNYYSALRALAELQRVHLQGVLHYRIADLIKQSVPDTQKLIAEAVMNDLNTWLFRIRETSQFLGEVAFYHTEQRRLRYDENSKKIPHLTNCKLNSPIALVADETDEFDILDNEDVQVDFSPLFECLHIHEALGQLEHFKVEYAATRRQQKELLMPSAITLIDAEGVTLNELLEGMAGFAIVERATLERASRLRSEADVEALWDSMSRQSVAVISKALDAVTNAEMLLKIRGVIVLFMQTMVLWGFSVLVLEEFLLVLFEKYAGLLKRRFSDDFHEIVSTDDYMPMPINVVEEYDKVLNVSWYVPDKSRDEMQFPCVLPFSQMYPLCCIDIRNFLNQFYFFSDDHFDRPKIIDETLRTSLDELLSNSVCRLLVERLNSQYLGQIVQILINLEHFEIACQELEPLLAAARSAAHHDGSVTLRATEEFRSHKKTAEKRIFELVNSKIDDLIGTAEYDWMSSSLQSEPSNYMQTLTRYLSNIMNSVLLGLPAEIKELIYFDALSHAASMILALPLAPDVKKINLHGIVALAKDVHFLADFVGTLGNPMLQENLDEVIQTMQLLQSENTDEFFDISVRNKKYSRVDAVNGAILLEKLIPRAPSQGRQEKLAALSSRFGIKS